MNIPLNTTDQFLEFMSKLNDLYAHSIKDQEAYTLMYGEVYKLHAIDKHLLPKIKITFHGFTETIVSNVGSHQRLKPQYRILYHMYRGVLDDYEIVFIDGSSLYAVVEPFDAKVKKAVDRAYKDKIKKYK